MASKSAGNAGHRTYSDWQRDLDNALYNGDLHFLVFPDFEAKVNGKAEVVLVERKLPDFTKNVNAGAAFLDEVDPGWWQAINTETLDLEDPNICVLGQGWSHYATSKHLLDRNFFASSNFNRFLAAAFPALGEAARKKRAAELGFAAEQSVYAFINIEGDRRATAGLLNSKGDTDTLQHCWDVNAEVYEHLTKTWLVLIKARQEQDKAKRAELVAQVATMSPEEIVDYFADK